MSSTVNYVISFTMALSPSSCVIFYEQQKFYSSQTKRQKEEKKDGNWMPRTFLRLFTIALILIVTGCSGVNSPSQSDGEFVMGRKDKGIVLTFDNAGIRCSFLELSQNGIFRTECNAIVRGSDGEIPAGSIETGLVLNWQFPKTSLDLSHFSVSECGPSTDQLSYSCLVERTSASGTLQLDFALNIRTTLEGETQDRTAEDSILLPFTISTFGLIPDMPVLSAVKRTSSPELRSQGLGVLPDIQSDNTSPNFEKEILALKETILPNDYFNFVKIQHVCRQSNELIVMSLGRVIAIGEKTFRFLAGSRVGGINGDTTSPRSIRFDDAAYLSCGPSGIVVGSPSFNRIVQINENGNMKVLIRASNGKGFGGDGGPSDKAKASNPAGVVQDSAGNIYFADVSNSRIRKITPEGTISTFAGGGVKTAVPGRPGHTVRLSLPRNLAIRQSSTQGFTLWSVEETRKRIIAFDEAGTVTRIYDSLPLPNSKPENYFGKIPFSAPMNPVHFAVGASEWLYYTERQESKIYRLNLENGAITFIAGNGKTAYDGDGIGSEHAVGAVPQLYPTEDGQFYLVSPSLARIRRMSPEGSLETWAIAKMDWKYLLSGNAKNSLFGDIKGMTFTPKGSLFSVESYPIIREIDREGKMKLIYRGPTAGESSTVELSLSKAKLQTPTAVVKHPSKNWYYIAEAIGNQIRAVDIDRQVVIPIAGNGEMGSGPDDVLALSVPLSLRVVPAAQGALPFSQQTGMVFLEDESLIFADPGNHKIRKISKEGVISTVIGTGIQNSSPDGLSPLETSIDSPVGLLLDAQENILFSEYYGRKIRMLTKAGTVTTLYDADAYAKANGISNTNDLPIYLPGPMTLLPTGELMVVSSPSRLAQVTPGAPGNFSSIAAIHSLFTPSDRGECAGGVISGTASKENVGEEIRTSLQSICVGEITAIASTSTCDPKTNKMTVALAQRFVSNIGGTGIVVIESACR